MAEVDALLAQIEEELATGSGSPSAERHHELLDLRRHTELRIKGLRKRVSDAQEAARLAQIATLAGHIGEFAATAKDGGKLAQALADVAEAAQRARDLAAQQDGLLGELQAAARALDVGRPSPLGVPQARHGHVAVDESRIMHGRVAVRRIGPAIDEAVTLAVAGHLGDAKARIAVVDGIEPRGRADHYLRGPNGLVMSLDELSEVVRKQIEAGELTVLSESQIRRYLTTGDVDG